MGDETPRASTTSRAPPRSPTPYPRPSFLRPSIIPAPVRHSCAPSVIPAQAGTTERGTGVASEGLFRLSERKLLSVASCKLTRKSVILAPSVLISRHPVAEQGSTVVHLQPEVVQHHPHIFSAAASIFAALILVIAGLAIYTDLRPGSSSGPPPPSGFGRLPLVRRRRRAEQRRARRAQRPGAARRPLPRH